MKAAKRNIYLQMKTLDEARRLWRERVADLRTSHEEVATIDGLHRVSAAPVTALLSVPHYHGAAMDGIAVNAADTFGASDVRPLELVLGENAFPVDTGDPLPEGTDAVIMIEQVEPVGDKRVEIRAAAFPWQHVRKVGEDIVAGELLLPQQHRLRPPDLGALLAAGVARLPVFRRPRVWIQPTGTELVPATEAHRAGPGQIIEFNGTVLAGMVRECGAEPELQEIIEDDYPKLVAAVKRAVDSPCDVILTIAGSSAGTEDYTRAMISELGEVLVHGVAMMPGKPVLLGIIGNKPVIGIPGYPVSAILAFEQFVRRLLFSLQGLPEPTRAHTEAVLGRKMPSRLGLEEFVRVIVGRVKGRLVAMPLQRGAGVITSLTRADGMLQIPQELEGIDVGKPVSVRLLRDADQLDHTLIMIGSHDNAIDLLANELKAHDSRIHLSSSNVGSLGGLMAVRREQTHLAGSHLLDTETGRYNESYIERYLQGIPVRLVQMTRRRQGLLLPPGNPKRIEGVHDLTRSDLRFINRQQGSGTRILFDHCLHREGIDPQRINGYDREEFTHMAVAVAVLSGSADCGMGIYAAAKALGLDFLPVAEERYDLVIPHWSWDDPKIVRLLAIVSGDRFRRLLEQLGGYDPSSSGRVEGVWDGSRWLESA